MFLYSSRDLALDATKALGISTSGSAMPLYHGIAPEMNPNYLLGLLVPGIQPLTSDWQTKIQTKYPPLRVQEPVRAAGGFGCRKDLDAGRIHP